ncbi:unnamed protein product [Echinostoma caproni]|uniref:HAP1 N-terminal domain-containing protein n=1 Tax=Echinostoma caproni TaxID=27848 RepID=A0A183AP31_9TREM|nr:unnamed protein product [Echinostoma caproni]
MDELVAVVQSLRQQLSDVGLIPEANLPVDWKDKFVSAHHHCIRDALSSANRSVDNGRSSLHGSGNVDAGIDHDADPTVRIAYLSQRLDSARQLLLEIGNEKLRQDKLISLMQSSNEREQRILNEQCQSLNEQLEELREKQRVIQQLQIALTAMETCDVTQFSLPDNARLVDISSFRDGPAGDECIPHEVNSKNHGPDGDNDNVQLIRQQLLSVSRHNQESHMTSVNPDEDEIISPRKPAVVLSEVHVGNLSKRSARRHQTDTYSLDVRNSSKGSSIRQPMMTDELVCLFIPDLVIFHGDVSYRRAIHCLSFFYSSAYAPTSMNTLHEQTDASAQTGRTGSSVADTNTMSLATENVTFLDATKEIAPLSPYSSAVDSLADLPTVSTPPGMPDSPDYSNVIEEHDAAASHGSSVTSLHNLFSAPQERREQSKQSTKNILVSYKSDLFLFVTVLYTQPHG